MDAYIPFETFLTAAEPVWVWDSERRRIVWANQAARRLWGEQGDASLHARRFPAKSEGLKQLSAIATRKNGSGQWTGPLSLPLPSGLRELRCQVQRLQLAGGAKGALARVLPEREDRPAPIVAPQPSAPAAGAAPRGGAGKKGFRPNAADMVVLAGLSHDLRNPLSAVIGFAHLLKTDPAARRDEARIRDYAECLSKSAQLALDLANDLMEFARTGRRTAAAAERPACPQIVAAECARLVKPLADQAGVSLSLAAAPVPDLPGVGERRLTQILLNLLLNSIKFTAAGGAIAVKIGMNRRNEIVIAVDDAGGSTRNELLAGERTVPGAGLGLVTVKRLLQDAGGRLSRRKKTKGGLSSKVIFPMPGSRSQP